MSIKIMSGSQYNVSLYGIFLNYLTKNCGYKKLLFHKIQNTLSKEMFSEYFLTNTERKNKNIKSIGIKIKGDLTDKYIPIMNYRNGKKEFAKGLYTYPEYSSLSKDEWNETFEKEEKDKATIKTDKNNDFEYTPINLYNKICDVKKKYPNDLKEITISTAEKSIYNLQVSSAPCVSGSHCETETLYIVVNDGKCEAICGGMCIAEINNNKYLFAIPSYAIKNMNVKCDKSQCQCCENCQNGSGNCVVLSIDLNNILVFKFIAKKTVNGETIPAHWDIKNTPTQEFYKTFIKNISLPNYSELITIEYKDNLVKFFQDNNLLNKFSFYTIVRKTISINEENNFYDIKCAGNNYNTANSYTDSNNFAEYTVKKLPYGYLRFNNQGDKICRYYFLEPNKWYIPCPSLFFLPMIFVEDKNVKICNNFQFTYDYWIPKEVFFSITKNCVIKTHISFNDTYRNDELLLGSVEIPPFAYSPSFDSTLNINENDGKNITDIRHDKLLNDNKQRIKFDEICNQTNRQLNWGVINLSNLANSLNNGE